MSEFVTDKLRTFVVCPNIQLVHIPNWHDPGSAQIPNLMKFRSYSLTKVLCRLSEVVLQPLYKS